MVLICISLIMSDVEHLFMCVSHPYVFFEEMFVQFLAHLLIHSFIFLALSCMNCLEINSLSVASFAVIFSYSEGYLFTLHIISFIVQKLLSLIRSHLFILSLFPLLWRWGIEDPAMIYIRECFAYVFL